jgi:chloride channel 3/4/5
MPDHTLIDWLGTEGAASRSVSTRRSSRRSGHSSNLRRHHDSDEPDRLLSVVGGIVSYAFEAIQPWLAAVAVGVACGLVASSTEVVTHWLTDLKLGFCSANMWASKFLCCLHDPRTGNGGDAGDGCAAFVYWAEWWGTSSSGSALASEMGIYIILTVLFAVLASWLCWEYAPCAAGSGIIEIKTILGGIRMNEYVAGHVLFIKCVALCASVGSGLSLGKEGPFVHLGTCIGANIGKLFPKYRRDEGASRELMSAAAAAGVAVAFGSPIGGVLFSLEEVSYFFPHRTMIQALVAAVVSTLVMKGLDATHTGRAVLFSISYHHEFHWFELPVFALIGILGGILGATMCRWYAAWTSIRMRASTLKRHPVREVFVVAVITGILNFAIPVMRGGMLGTLVDLFDDCSHGNANGFLCVEDESPIVVQLLLAVVLRMIMTVLTTSCALPAGVFVPSLFIGGCLGRAVGIWTRAIVVQNYAASDWLHSSCGADPSSCVVPGVYAIVGAAAVLGGVTHMTMSLVVIMFELTGGLEYIVPCMLVVITSRWVCDVLGVPSIYDIQLDFKEYPYLNIKAEVSWEITVRDFLRYREKRLQRSHLRSMATAAPSSADQSPSQHTIPQPHASHHVVVFWDGMTLGTLESLLAGCSHRWFPVVSSLTTYLFVGSISRDKAEGMLSREHSAGAGDTAAARQSIQVYFTTSVASAAARTAAVTVVPPSSREQAMRAAGGRAEPLAARPSHTAEVQQRLAVVRDWSALVHHCSVQASPDMAVNGVLIVFRALGNQHVVVVDGGRLVDLITRGDMINFLRTGRANEGARGSLKRWIRHRGCGE